MIVYNVTVKIDLDQAEDWLNWMKNKHIPDVMNTGLFVSNRICRLLEIDESDGITYSIQYSLENMDDYHRYVENFAAALQKKHNERYKDRFTAFRTIMRIV